MMIFWHRDLLGALLEILQSHQPLAHGFPNKAAIMEPI